MAGQGAEGRRAGIKIGGSWSEAGGGRTGGGFGGYLECFLRKGTASCIPTVGSTDVANLSEI
jgi:hypothetical protein